MTQCKLSSLLFFVVSLSAGLSEHRLLYVVLVVQVVFPISARRLSNDGLLFLKKLPQKLFFVVSLSAGLSETLRLLYVVLVVQVVFPMSAASSARRRSKDGLLFLKKLPQKLFFVVSLSAGLSETLRLLYVVLVVQVVFPISARRTSKKPQHKILTNQLTPD